MTNPYISDTDVFALLDELIPDTLATRTVGAQEWLRLKLTEVMIEARKRAGLTQSEVAQRMGVGQARVSKLENANNDRTIDSVVAYLMAVDAELSVAVRQNGELHQASRESLTVDLPYQQQSMPVIRKGSTFTWEGEIGLEMARKNEVQMQPGNLVLRVA